MSTEQVSLARSLLVHCLKSQAQAMVNGDSHAEHATTGEDLVAKYMALLKAWFKMAITRDQFDREARALLPQVAVPLHNRFLLSILTRVQGLSDLTARARVKSSPRSLSSLSPSPSSCTLNGNGYGYSDHGSDADRAAKAPTDNDNIHIPPALCDVLREPDEIASEPGRDGRAAECRWSSNELFLPDQALVTGRLLLTAWEMGLDGAEDAAAELIVSAVQVFLKNILSVVMSQRRAYKVCEGNFVHGIGCEVPNAWLRNAPDDSEEVSDCVEFDENDDEIAKPSPSIAASEHSAAYDIACSVPKSATADARISLRDVYDALKVHRNAIASHSVYAINMERIATLLDHPGH